MSNKEHWDKIYTTKTPEEVSWTEDYPQMSIDLIAKSNIPKFTKIIDIGGGDSRLVDALLDLGYTNITVLDISNSAIDRAKARLGQKAQHVKWIVSDILDFSPAESYDLWHDRAVFHFLTKQADIHK
jgi:trans-aconitate methyltransferase